MPDLDKIAVGANTPHIPHPHSKKPELLPVRALRWRKDLNYLRTGGKSVQLPCATSAAMLLQQHALADDVTGDEDLPSIAEGIKIALASGT